MEHLIYRKFRLFLLTAISLFLFFCGPISFAEKTPPQNALTFEKEIVPILRANCFECHGEKKREADLDLRRRFTMLQGGESGAAIEIGKPGESLLIEMIEDGQMPPEEKGRLSDQQIKILRQWITQGAPLANKQEPPLENSSGDSEVNPEDRNHWAFQPPQRPVVPHVKNNQRVRNPVDAFLLARLEQKGLAFNDDADKRVLLRRLCFDLLGLPPTTQQIDSFLSDDRPDAYEQLVDRLLASPRYGERWGRHWLDLAGYADSDGYLEADRLRPEAWRYRDYVIRAANADKPFNHFLLEQFAGDELSDWRRAKELTPQLIDNLTATGFLRTAADPTYGNYKQLLECHKVMADTIQIISSSILGITMQCARCHSHKAEPILQRDYYRLHAVLLASYDPQQWIVSSARSIPLVTEVEQVEIEKQNQLIQQRVTHLTQQLNALISKYRDKHLSVELAAVDPQQKKQVAAAILLAPKKRTARQKKLLADKAPGVKADEQAIAARYPEFKTRSEKIRMAIAAEKALKNEIVQLRGLMDMGDAPRQAHILIRGDFNKPGVKVIPGIPAVLTRPGESFQPQRGYKTSGRRLAFAQWLVDPRHPLTARVRVNRIWAHHFGRGIVPTLDNFGRSGTPPTHPQLLDWLATEFMRSGWSEKKIHRLLLTSSAYRQSSAFSFEKKAVDSANDLLWSWRPLRHEGEVLRDSVLALSGKLNSQMYGRPADIERRPDGEVIVKESPLGQRRSIYLQVRRSRHVTLLDLFDTPKMEINCPQRNESTVVTQALTLMNSSFTETNAASLAKRICRHSGDREIRIAEIYRRLFSRHASNHERQWISLFLEDFARQELGAKFSSATDREAKAAYHRGWKHVAQVLINCNEFIYIH